MSTTEFLLESANESRRECVSLQQLLYFSRRLQEELKPGGGPFFTGLLEELDSEDWSQSLEDLKLYMARIEAISPGESVPQARGMRSSCELDEVEKVLVLLETVEAHASLVASGADIATRQLSFSRFQSLVDSVDSSDIQKCVAWLKSEFAKRA